MRFDLNDLSLFLHVVDTGSITAGAERANLALASASTRIRGMEDDLGEVLLVRQKRGVSLTPSGDALAHHARILLRQHNKMREELREYAQGLRGHIRLMCNTASLSESLPDLLGLFLEAHPNINIDLEERLSHEIVAALMEQATDVGILANSVDVANLEVFPFSHDRMTLITSPDHPLAKTKRIYFSDALNYDFIGLQEGSALQEFLTERAIRIGKRFKYRVRMRSFDTVCRMVAKNIGIGVVPEAVAARNKKTLKIHTLQLQDNWATRELIICVRSLNDLPTHTRHLVEHLQRSAEQKVRARRKVSRR